MRINEGFFVVKITICTCNKPVGTQAVTTEELSSGVTILPGETEDTFCRVYV